MVRVAQWLMLNCAWPPDNFDFKKPDNCQCWKCCFEQFCSALGLPTAGEGRQISTVLYCPGQDAEEVLPPSA